MTEFRVHFIKTDGDKTTHVVNADSPAQAAAIIRRKNPGVNVTKVKVNKAGNVSVRGSATNWKVEPHRPLTAEDFRHEFMLNPNTDGIINGRTGTVIMNELSEAKD